MKSLKTCLVAVLVAAIFPLQEAVCIENGSFEDGINGWSPFLWTDYTEGPFLWSDDWPGLEYPYDYITIPLFSDPTEGFVTNPASTLSPSGSMLQLYYTEPTLWYHITSPDHELWVMRPVEYGFGFYQDIELEKGELLSGWARFDTTAYERDRSHATVAVNDSVVWSVGASDFSNPWPIFVDGDSGWQYWSFYASSSGTYRLSLDLYGEFADSSTAYFDNIKVTVPDSNLRISFLLPLFALILAAGKRWRV